jgi:hypothetical protein
LTNSSRLRGANSWNVIKMTYPSRKMIMIVDVEDKSVQKPPVIMQEVFVVLRNLKNKSLSKKICLKIKSMI